MNRYLLDTHTFLWWVQNSPKLSSAAKNIISDLENECFLSIASAWEMAIKCSLGKLILTTPLKKFVPEQMAANSFILLPVSFVHICQVENLPFHHRDPFDRLLIAQAISEKIPIISADKTFKAYDLKHVW